MARTRFNFFIDDAQRKGLRAIKETRGVGESEQIRRAIDEWLKQDQWTPSERKVKQALEDFFVTRGLKRKAARTRRARRTRR